MKCRQNQEFSKMWTCCHRWPRSKCCCCWKGERRWARLTENGGVLLQKAGKCKGELQLVWTISLLSYFIREVNSLGTFYLCPDQHVFRCWLWRRGKGEGAKENEMKELTAKAIAGEEIKPVAWKSKEGVGERSMGGGESRNEEGLKVGTKMSGPHQALDWCIDRRAFINNDWNACRISVGYLCSCCDPNIGLGVGDWYVSVTNHFSFSESLCVDHNMAKKAVLNFIGIMAF